jgi:hypothetical protein
MDQTCFVTVVQLRALPSEGFSKDSFGKKRFPIAVARCKGFPTL